MSVGVNEVLRGCILLTWAGHVKVAQGIRPVGMARFPPGWVWLLPVYEERVLRSFLFPEVSSLSLLPYRDLLWRLAHLLIQLYIIKMLGF